MDDTYRKVTVEVRERDLALAQKLTGEGVTETMRAALRQFASTQAQRELLKYRGKAKFKLSLDQIKHDRR